MAKRVTNGYWYDNNAVTAHDGDIIVFMSCSNTSENYFTSTVSGKNTNVIYNSGVFYVGYIKDVPSGSTVVTNNRSSYAAEQVSVVIELY